MNIQSAYIFTSCSTRMLFSRLAILAVVFVFFARLDLSRRAAVGDTKAAPPTGSGR